ncbi:MAG: zinc ABC transporter substrate-binding protein [Clostridia bacterium]|nr:zinc ABC transporter substrate-binding protein [Clostridia bacterium]
MNRNGKIAICITVAIICLVAILWASSLNKKKMEDNSKLNIVTTTFSCYDFSKQIVGDKANVTLLMDPGADEHSYEPTASDLIKIKNADIFIYLGGEIEKWSDKVLESDTVNREKTTIIKVTDCIDLIEEVEVDGAEEEEEEEDGAFDEHIWSSPANAIKMMNYICEKVSTLDEENRNFYKENTDKYVSQIKEVQAKIKEIVDNKKRDRLIFGDKMPMQYFLNEYGLKVSAAFNGCSTEAEPSAKTITYLINKVKDEQIPVVLYIELSTGKTAKSIANETGAKAMQIQTLHNISKDDFNNGETYVSLMNKNLDVLKKALQ